MVFFDLRCGINSPAETGAGAALCAPGFLQGGGRHTGHGGTQGLKKGRGHTPPPPQSGKMDPQTHFCRTNSSVTNFLTSPKTSCRSLRAVGLTRGSSNETRPPLSVYVSPNILPWLHPEPAEEFPDSTWKRGCQWWWGSTKGEWSTERRGGLTVFGRVALHEYEAEDDEEEP